MAQYERRKEQRHRDMIQSYYERLIETEKHREKERLASLCIQKNWRMLKVKWRFEEIQSSCVIIQRIFRGFQGRKEQLDRQLAVKNDRQNQFFHEQAKLVQKHFRGFYSRKYEHDFYARKKYLQHVEKKNEEVRAILDSHHKKQLMEEAKRQEDCARAEFGELAGNLHHLTSTKSVPGVYNPPYSQLKPQAFNVDIETHLKSTFKSNFQWKPASKDKINFFRQLAKQQQAERNQLGIATK